MAIDTYAKLQSEISDVINRADLLADVTKYSTGTIEGAIKRAIRKCELRAQRTLRIRFMESSTTLTFASGTGSYALPSDFLSTRLVYISRDPVQVLQQTSLETLFTDYPGAANSIPEKIAVSGTSLYVRPTPDATYSVPMFYYQEIPALSDTNTSNWLLVRAPDLYLYGACIELMPHIMDDQRIQVWKGAYDEAIRLLNEDDDAAKWNGVLVQSSLPVQIVV
jgi:hypothetical protein